MVHPASLCRPCPGGTAESSPAIHRWEGGGARPKSQRDGRLTSTDLPDAPLTDPVGYPVVSGSVSRVPAPAGDLRGDSLSFAPENRLPSRPKSKPADIRLSSHNT